MSNARDIADSNLDSLTVDTTTLVVDSTNNRVGIGTASPVYTMHTHNAGNTFVYNKFTNSSTGTGSGDGLDVGISGVNALIYNNESGNIQFATSGSERMRIQSGGGISFNGDTAAANALDDYEEGTWTPSIEFGGSAATTSVTRARYVKVGSLVSLSATITCSSTPASGTFVITNLPFSPSANVETTGNVMCSNVNTETSTVNLVTYQYGLNTDIHIYATRDNGHWYAFTNSHVSSSDQFIFTHTYYTS